MGSRDHRQEVGQHRLADRVDPMRVLDDEKSRFGARQRGGVDQRGQLAPPRIGIDLRRRYLGVGDAQQIVEEQQVLRVGTGDLFAHPARGRLRLRGRERRFRRAATAPPAWNGMSLAWDSQKAQYTSTPRPAAAAAASLATRLLPMPGGPTTIHDAAVATGRPVDDGVDRRHLPVTSNQARLGAPYRGHLAGRTPSAGVTRTGSSDPLIRTHSGSASTAMCSTSDAVESDSITPPGGATDSIRCAIPT